MRPLFLIASAIALIPQQASSTDRYTEFTKRVQEKLHEQGFDAGPVNGEFWTKTQAALAQFQLSRTLPASGQLDDATLAALGVERDPPAPDDVSSESTTGGSHASQ